MKQDQTDDEMFFKHWEAKFLSITSKNLNPISQSQIIISEPIDFNERYAKLKTKLESELARRIVYLKYSNLPEIIPEGAIIDMSDSTISEDEFLTEQELLIMRQYKKT